MAEDLNKFKDELEDIEKSIKGLTDVLETSVLSSLTKSVSKVKELGSAFNKGKDISKQVAKQAFDIGVKNEIALLKEDKIRKQLNAAIRAGNVAKQNSLAIELQQIKAERQINEKIDSQLRNLLALNEERKKQNNLLELTKNKLKESLAPIKELFTIGGLFKVLVDGLFKMDNQATQLGKSLGISKSAALELRKSMSSYAAASMDSFVNTERLFKAQEGLTEQLGIAVDFGNKERETFARLTEITGLTADEAGKLAKFSAVTGKSTKDYVSSLRVAGMEASRANKIHISDKELLSSVAKLSAGILVKFQGNPKALADAVIQAKKLGLSLEQVDKIGDSMLNWESSIENELEAELITGRKLNFEKARAAALTGDQATLMQEVAAQAGSLAEYQNMNVIAQESLAKAFGMSRDDMSDMLMKQEAIAKYGDAAGKLNKEQLEDMKKRNMSAADYLNMVENQRSVQEKFNDLITKLQDSLVNIASGPLGTIIKGFDWLLNQVWLIYPVIGAIAGLMAGKMVMGIINFGKGISQAIPKMLTLLGLSEAKAVSEITAAEAISFGLATVGIIAGIVSAVSAMNSAKSSAQTVQDGIAPSGNGPFTITDAYGATAITAKGDGLAVSPNINKEEGGMDLSPMIAAINEVRNAVNALANKPTNVVMDSQKVGALVGRRAETGTEQTKNSYRLA